MEIAEKKRVKPRLPDLQISKLQGVLNPPTSIPDEAKFSYLKEFVIPKVRVTIERLPADGAGYEKAKEFSQQRYSDPGEVVNAHIQEIMSLPVITGNSKPILEKLKQVAGNVRMTLDKLVGIQADLIRTEKDWEK